MTDMLEECFKYQLKLQQKFGTFPFKSEEDRIKFIKDMTIATIDEVMEFIREIPWKPC